ncbi:MAG: anti-CBASS protein Acb1 family protein [Chlamydiales bacterium]
MSNKNKKRDEAKPIQNAGELDKILKPEVVSETEWMIRNGLAYAMGVGDNGFGFGSPQTTGTQLSQSTTLFKNLRWYLVSNMRQLLTELYAEIGVVQTITDVPVDDALRGGIDITSKQLSEDQVHDLIVATKREKLLKIIGQTAKWTRLYGGGGTLIITGEDADTPFDVTKLKKGDHASFRSGDMWEFFWDKQNTEGYDTVLDQEDFDFYSFYGNPVHKTRVMKMVGMEAPSFIQPRLRGWGMSECERLVRPLNQYLKATDVSFEVIDEFKLDIYKIKDLTNTLFGPNGYEKVRERIAIANRQKNYQNAVVLDSLDDYDHKQLSFAGLDDVMDGIRMQIASELRMPLTKLFGISAAGFNSGEDDLEVYNAMVESQVRTKIEFDILRMLEIKCQVMFGFIPDDLEIHFKPLRMMTTEQEQTSKTQEFQRVLQTRQAGEMSSLEFRQAVNKAKLIPIQLEEGGVSDELGNPDMAGDQDVDPDGTQDDSNEEMSTFTEKSKLGKNEYGGSKQKLSERRLKEDKTDPYMQNSQQVDTDEDQFGAFKKYFDHLWDRLLGVKSEIENSAQYDRASYESEGGDDQPDHLFAEGREIFLENPGKVDEALWSKAKEISKAAFGKTNWKFVTWKYKDLGGKFN